jgi:kynureninase
VRSQLEHHGYDPASFLIEVQPRAETGLLATADILSAIESNQERLALVLLGGVNYLTGQLLEMETIASRVAELNASAADAEPLILGYDLAHAVGNVPLKLSEWGVDFAAW